ncbi:hypothetical protein LXL04_020200 [Taraxacum kok-saghyz]
MDIFSEENLSFTPIAASPRISFSHNLDNSIIESYPYRSNSSPDFNFCFTSFSIENEAPSADELFSNGLIRHNSEDNISLDGNSSALKHVPSAITDHPWKQESSKEIISPEGCEENQSKSFWRIKRSSSLHCESTKQRSSFWSSLPLLSRSNSTGSGMKDRQNKQNPSQKQSNKNSSSMAVVINNNGYSSLKPPLKRSYGGGCDYGIRVSPVLNVPPHFISKSAANLLGLGSLFLHGSHQKTKK